MRSDTGGSSAARNEWVVWVLLAVFGAVGLLVGTIVLVTRVSCGRWPDAEAVPSMVSFFWTGDPATVATAGECAATSTAVWSTLAGVAVLVIAAVIGALVTWYRYKQSDRYFVRQLYRRDGLARRYELRRKVGPRAIRKVGKEVRPSVKRPKVDQVGHWFGTSRGYPVWASMEDSVCLWGPARSGKGLHLIIDAILDAPGAVVSTSTRTDNYLATRDLRAQRGPVAVFDPQGLAADTSTSTVRWSPFSGCEDQRVANERATSLVTASGLGSSDRNTEWKTPAATILASLLHAAALSRAPITDLYQWSANPITARAAVDVLKSHGPDATQWGIQLEGVINGDEKMRTNQWFGVSGAMSSLAVPEYREAMSPGPDGGLDVDRLLEESGTLYVLGTQSGGSSVGPFLIALLDEVKTRAEEKAAKSKGNRLDPPVKLVLDEIANLGAVWPGLKNLMSAGGGSGIMTFAVFQSGSQTRNQWGRGEAEEIFDTATVSVLLGGLKNTDDLEKVSKLSGSRRETQVTRSYSDNGRSSSEQSSKEHVLDIDDLRRLPFGHAVMIRRDARPMFVELRRWTNRKDAKQIKESLGRSDAATLGELTSGAKGELVSVDAEPNVSAADLTVTDASPVSPPVDPTAQVNTPGADDSWIVR